ncbi:MAG TPA: PDZ domain-containing protein [Thermoanaerobaculia bacterium]
MKTLLFLGWVALLPLARPCHAGALAEAPGERGYLGFQLISHGDRALVGKVTPGGPGEKAGLIEGDAIVEFNGVPFKFDSDVALIRGLSWLRPGVPVNLTVERKHRKLHVVVTPSRFRPQDLLALEDWLRGAELTEQAQKEACAMEAFKALAAPPGIEVSFRKSSTGKKGYAISSSRYELPPHLDLSEPYLEHLLRRLKPGDLFTLRYQWSGGKLRSEVVKVPDYVNLEEVNRQTLDEMRARGAIIRKSG